MSMLDSFFTKGFKAAKCKTLLKLTIPRIKLLRNRRESQLKQMRRDIAKLLENGQEATARIRVEHIIREEKMMAAQEIVELFSELISVRLPIIETQRECPLDLKEAISSVCFAAPRCADLPELQQVQILFAAKYGREFVAAATELMPECGVNRKLVELLSVRAPDPEVKLKLLKDIAEEHELDWDPAASESELLKPHEDLLNGPTQFVGGSKSPLTNEKRYEKTYAAPKQSPTAHSDSDDDVETMDFPEVPKASIRQTEPINDDDTRNTIAHEGKYIPPITNQTEPESESQTPLEEVSSVAKESDLTKIPWASDEASKQSVPFVSPPLSSMKFPVRESEPPQSPPRTRSDANVDLQDVLAAAQSAADSAERAAASARSAASLAEVRISELIKKQSNKYSVDSSDNPFHLDTSEPNITNQPQISRDNSSRDNIIGVTDFTDHKVEYDSPETSNDFQELPHQCQRLPSFDDEYFSYPNLFKRQDSDIEPSTHSTN